ncbi:6-phosphofructokinase [Methyloversatilis sp. XJ19-49]|uniref:6-phosphofructokinase n=1 Tax=Methyloversatilis sp. XJ19-49 TaxID=2963429 RepID=UPI00211B8695|nr:6-phosphofructokinase [Methyloversatilis sp. XJ19-49]MCQ9376804.1 6-phosphofructokinase [Methyloversatilis sp. XJ19-49]
MAANLFYAQSGGVTAVINATACGVIQAAREQGGRIGKVFAGRNGILGALHEDLIDTSFESDAAIAALRHTPGGAFGSCRYKLKGLDESRAHYERLIDVFRAHDIRYFLYNGGNDSMDTAWKVSQIAERLNYPLVCVGVPKTVDNDLVGTDNCPGFGSVAKYVAVSMMEAGLDVASMARTSTKIFVMEVMGRHAGWITAAAGLAARNAGDAPHLLLFPEIPFDQAAFMARVDACVREHQFCAIAVSEGLRGPDGKLLAESGTRDAFGHAQLGGVGQQVAELIKAQLGHKYHWALPDYLQRSGRHIASATDAAQAHALGRRAVELALEGRNAVMPAIVRTADSPYQWEIGVAQLADVANHEKMMPRDFISDDGFGITDACRRYLQPLIAGEDYPPYVDGLPAYVSLKNESVAAVLPAFGG